MLVFKCEIRIGGLLFDFVHSIEIKSSWRTLTDTAVIELPKNLATKTKKIVETFKTGDPVEIKMGYSEPLITEFKGYIARSPSTDIPMSIYCEDEAFNLKRSSQNISYTNTKLKTIVEQMAPDYEVDTYDHTVSLFRLSNKTAAQGLEEIKSRLFFYSFFRNGKLVVGKPFSTLDLLDLPVPVFHFQKNIIGGSIDYKLATDRKVQLRGISINDNNTRVEVEVGDTDGEVIEVPYYNMNEAQLREVLELKIDEYKHDGYEGTIRTFGSPSVQHGQKVRIIDELNEERDSQYLVDSVTKLFTIGNAYKQDIELGKEVTN